MKIAFIGLGKMGSGMARNLLRAGHAVTLYNRSREKAEALAADGATVASTPAEACRDAEAAISMLGDDHAVQQAVLGDQGIAAGLPRRAVHISSSTISTSLARCLDAEHGKRGQGFLSAVVFGRPEAAADKKLVVVAAGAKEHVDRFRPIFDAIGRATYVAGTEPWQANALKLCGNFMIASMLESFSEAFATVRKASVDRHLFLEVMNALFASPVYSTYGGIIADERFEPAGFGLRLGLKDVRLVLDTALECESPMPLASVIRERFIDALAHGQADQDWASLARVSARAAGLE